jgi:hypothetical protein
MKYYILLFIPFVFTWQIQENEDLFIVNKVLKYFNENILYKLLCEEVQNEEMESLGGVSSIIRAEDIRYCLYGFLYNKTICSDYILAEYSLPLVDPIHFNSGELYLTDDEISLLSSLWDYYKEKSIHFEKVLLKSYHSNIRVCDYSDFINSKNSNDLFIKPKRPIKSNDLIYIQLDLIYPDQTTYMVLDFALNNNHEILGWMIFYTLPLR